MSRESTGYDYCRETKTPVIIHAGIKAVRWQHMKYNNPIYADDVATDFPGLNDHSLWAKTPGGFL